MSQRDHVRPDGNVVDRPDVQVVRGIAPHHAGDQGPGAEQTRRQRGELVAGLGVGLVGDELVDGVFGVERLGRDGELGVADEAAVVDATGEVEGRVGLDAVADGDD